jgi:hypothetical protein
MRIAEGRGFVNSKWQQKKFADYETKAMNLFVWRMQPLDLFAIILKATLTYTSSTNKQSITTSFKRCRQKKAPVVRGRSLDRLATATNPTGKYSAVDLYLILCISTSKSSENYLSENETHVRQTWQLGRWIAFEEVTCLHVNS